MKAKYMILFVMLHVLLGCNSKAVNIELNTDDKYQDGLVVDDKSITEQFVSGATKLYETGNYVRLEELTSQLISVGNFLDLDIQSIDTTYTDYKDLKKSTLVLAQMYVCDQCPDMHLSPATGFVIDKRGICVTNYHVFEKLGQPMRGAKLLTAMDYKGRMLAIEQVLCASKENDLAVFKVNTNGIDLHPIKLSAEPIEVGQEMSLISHPIGNYYEYTQGYARRYFKNAETSTLRLATSVEFAVSSSGGAMYNHKGEVVAIVSSTSPYFGGNGNQRMIQMVNYETIPVSILRKMVGLDK